jgi:hypothetical protein
MARLPAFVALVSAGLIATAAAQSVRLGYEAYAGGLHVMSIDVSIEEHASEYRVATDLRTRGLADFFVGMHIDSQTIGSIQRGDVAPLRYLNHGTFGSRERLVTLGSRPDGGFDLHATPPPEGEDRTPIPSASLPGSVDPLSAILRASHVIAATGSCRLRIPVFDGRRRYDLAFTDQGDRQLTPSRYSVFAGPARLCRLRQERVGGFLRHETEKGIGRESSLWIASPVAGAPPVPVRLELDTDWGWLTIHLEEVSGENGSARFARNAGNK